MTTSNLTLKCIRWIQNWFKYNGPGCNAVIGISGGKDSTVTAMLCVEALGKDRVIGVLMPNGDQKDIEDSYKVVKTLGIRYFVHNIEDAVSSTLNEMESNDVVISQQTVINLPPRIRMSTLYAYSQSLNGRVAETSNLSETILSWCTLWGDNVGSFSPLGKLTVAEVKEIGYYLKLPKDLIDKAPADGLCGMTDEDKFGFSYEVLDKYIRGIEVPSAKIKNKIDEMYLKGKFKSNMVKIDTFDPHFKNIFN